MPNTVEEFSITYSEVSKIKDDLIRHANNMRDILDDVTTKINSVHSQAWESTAASEHLSSYKTLARTYEKFYGDVTNLANFLTNIIEGKKDVDVAVGKVAVDSTGHIV